MLAARSLVALMPDSQLCAVNGMPHVEFVECGRDHAVGLCVATCCRKWSTGYMRQLASLWCDVIRFSHAACRRMIDGRFSGSFVQSYLDRVEARARVKWMIAHPDPDRAPVGAAKGSTARGGAGSKLRTLAEQLRFPLEIDSLGAKVAMQRKKRVGRRKRSATERVLLKLERMAELAPTPCARTCAAGLAAMCLNALRHKSATRFRILRASCGVPAHASPAERAHALSSGGTVHGVVLTDPKSSLDDGIPAVTSVRGVSGSRAWLDVMLDAQRACTTKCLVYDMELENGSLTGDPFRAVRLRDAPASRQRTAEAMHSLLLSDICEPAFTPEMLEGLTPHSLKHLLATVSRNSFDPESVSNEIGKWSGSSSQTEAPPPPPVGVAAAPSAAALASCPIVGVYTPEALGEGGSVSVIMEAQIFRIRRRIAACASVDDLPPVGGFGYYAAALVPS